MKIHIEDSYEFELEAENYAEKLWMANFIKEADKNDCVKNLEVIFSYHEDRYQQGGGWANPKQIVLEDHFSAEENENDKTANVLIYVDEIKKLCVRNNPL